MYMLVGNLNRAYNAFFRAIPYDGPQVQLTGAQPYDTVSGTLSLQASVTDLSGTTNELVLLTANGLPARVSQTENTFSVDTTYIPSGQGEIEFYAGNASALVYDPTNPPLDTKTAFQTSVILPLDFENGTYLEFAGDLCSPDVVTNYILFVIDQAQNVSASITDPTSGRTVVGFSGYVPGPAEVQIPWNFQELDGSPYTNDSYGVTFTAEAAAVTLAITNTIQRSGVRAAAGNILVYMDEDPGNPTGQYLDYYAYQWIDQALANGLYLSIYDTDFASTTQYTVYQVGPNRDNPASFAFPYVCTRGNEAYWINQAQSVLTNLSFSDFGLYMGHGSGTFIGGAHGWISGALPSTTAASAVRACGSQNWRMRKVVLWACYTDSPDVTTAQHTVVNWHDAFGITATSLQRSSLMAKNVGLFFGGELPQGNYSGTSSGAEPEVAALFDDLWVTSIFNDPTYSFGWAVDMVRGLCPEIDNGKPAWIGFGYLPYSANFDAQIMTNNIDGIQWPH